MFPSLLFFRSDYVPRTSAIFYDSESDPFTGKPYPDLGTVERRKQAKSVFDLLCARAEHARAVGDWHTVVECLRRASCLDDISAADRSNSQWEIAKLSVEYVPALHAIQELLPQIEQWCREDDDFDLLHHYACICRYLWETDRLIQFRKSLERDSENHTFLGNFLFSLLMDERRYSEAAALKPLHEIWDKLEFYEQFLVDKNSRLSSLAAEPFLSFITAYAGAGRQAEANRIANAVLRHATSEKIEAKIADALRTRGGV